MADNSRVLIVSEDTYLKGDVRNGGRIEVYGYLEGSVTGDNLIVKPSGRCYGTVKVETADVQGDLQGQIFVKQLITIRGSGSVTGDVQYGRLAMEMGANLSAEVRNVPPTLSGDLDLSVNKGQSVRITLQDLNALDPDNEAHELTFNVSQAKNGFVSLSSNPASPIEKFTQADLERGDVMFRHDGNGGSASFDVIVVDAAGASSGAAQTVNVSVR